MLRRIVLGIATVVAASAGLLQSVEADDGGVTCPPNEVSCVVVVNDPGRPSGTGPSASSSPGSTARVCRLKDSGNVIPCSDPVYGWWSSADDCYYRRVQPPPPETVPEWDGHYPNGAIYVATCPEVTGTGGGWVWFADPPDGYGGVTATPRELAQQAIDTMRLVGADIRTEPARGLTGLVGLPVWLWTPITATTWGPNSAKASVPALTVTATAKALRIVWDMGDGHSVTCRNPGSAYDPALGMTRSPSCGYVYGQSSASQPGQAYAITATTTWRVTWAGGGQAGVLTVTRVSTSSVRIGELQVLVS